MSHEILGERFFGHRTAAWHGLGYVTEADMTAGEAYVNHIGRYDVTLEPIVAGTSGLVVFEDRLAIVRHPIEEDPEYRNFGIVSDQYGLVTPDQAVGIWDRCIKLPVETMAVVRDGKCLLITAELPSYDVKGDEIKDYIAFHNWMDGSHMQTMLRSGVRQVCMNTMRLAESLATETYRARHGRDVHQLLENWLMGFVERAIAKQAAVKEACELLASTRADDVNAQQIVTAAYPDARMPSKDVPSEVYEIKWAEYEADVKIVDERRATALDLFLGDGRGSESIAADGTVWGVYQGVVECENYRRGGNDRSAQESVLIGTRGDAITRAFDAALAACQN